MRITKCDLCKKQIKGDSVTAGFGFLQRAELCQKCGSSILIFLKKRKLIESKKEVNSPKLYGR